MKSNKGFLLIEVILAIGIIGGVALCVLGLFSPIFTKAKDLELTDRLEEAAEKINILIQISSFEEIYWAARRNERFYFYQDEKGLLTMSTNSKKIKTSKDIIKATLSPSMMTPILSYEPQDYTEGYFAICVEIDSIQKPKPIKYIAIKSR